MRRIVAAVALFLVPHAAVFAHELDEYVQAALISLAPDRIDVQLRLVPGAEVFKRVLAGIDTNGDGAISNTEQQAYANRVVHDLVLTMNGHALTPEIVSTEFPPVDLMKAGLGEIHIALRVSGVTRAARQELVMENRHQRAISAYLVNTLAPRDRSLQIVAQRRSSDQSRYEVEYEQRATASASAAAR